MSKVTKKEENTALQTSSLFSGYAGVGSENITAKDMSVPILTLLEALSPQCNKRDEAFVEGAEPGFIFENVTRQIFEEVSVIPVFFEKVFVEWVDRDSGGGLVQEYPYTTSGQIDVVNKIIATAKKDDNGDLILPNSNMLVETARYYLLNTTPGANSKWAVVNMTKSRLKSSRQWNTIIANTVLYNEAGAPFAGPIFCAEYKMKAHAVSKTNRSWNIWDIQQIRILDEKSEQDVQLVNNALSLYEVVKQGSLKIVQEPDHNSTTMESTASEVL